MTGTPKPGRSQKSIEFPGDGWKSKFSEGAYTPCGYEGEIAMRAAYERDKAAGWFDDTCVDLPDDACIDFANVKYGGRGTELRIPGPAIIKFADKADGWPD